MHLMIVLREYEDFGTHNRRRKRLAKNRRSEQSRYLERYTMY